MSGLVSALLGIGGGIVSVPALTIVQKISIKKAVGSSLISVACVALSCVLAELWIKPENLLWDVAAILSVGAVIGTYIGRIFMLRWDERFLKLVYSGFLLLVALRMMGVFEFAKTAPFVWSEALWLSVFLSVGTGVLAGMSSTLFGVGGGVVAVPLLLLLFSNFSFHEIRATSLIMIIPAASLGILHHRNMGNVDISLGVRIALPAMLAAIFGVWLVQRVDAGFLRSAFAIILTLTAWRFLREELGKKKGEDQSSP